jgi:AcrR family transcriptional regulator
MVTRKKASPEPRPRNSEATQERILKSVGRLLARRGFLGFGVNAVAREARVDKVLIYRYFGGLPQLLESFADRGDFWPTAEELVGAPPEATSRWSAADWSIAALRGLLRGLRARPTTQEILRWELAVSNDLTEKLAEIRERRGIELLRRVPLDPRRRLAEDVPAVAALLSAGVIYLVLRSKTAPAWLGVSLDTEEGWARIERAIETIVRRVLRAADAEGGES